MARFRRPCLLLVTTFLLSGCSSRVPTEPISIALLAPLSGPEKTAGQHARQGVTLAVEEVNREENRIAGRKVEVRFVDTHGEAEALQTNAVRLVTLNKVAALLGGSDVAEADRLARAAQPYGVPVITPAGLPPGGALDNLFSTGVAPAYQGKALAQFVNGGDLKPKPASMVVLVEGRDEVGAALADAFVQDVKKGGETRAEVMTYRGDSEFLDLVERLHKAPPPVLLLVGTEPGLVRKLRDKLGEGGPTALLYGGELDQVAAFRASREASDGAYLATPYGAQAESRRNQDFVERYKKQFTQEPDANAALAYDAAQLLFQALRQAKPLTVVRLREELARPEQFAALTGVLAFDKGKGNRRPVFILRLQDGQAKHVKTYDPEGK